MTTIDAGILTELNHAVEEALSGERRCERPEFDCPNPASWWLVFPCRCLPFTCCTACKRDGQRLTDRYPVVDCTVCGASSRSSLLRWEPIR